MTPVLIADQPRATPRFAPPEDITRRRLLTAVPGVILVAAGVACGDDDPEATATASPTSTPTAASRFPRTVQHALGSTTIDAEPQRIVALIDRDADTLLALGITPVAIRSRYGFEAGVGPWATDRLGAATPTVWGGGELDLEAIVAVQPDLLVYTVSGGDTDEYEALSQIAPTLALPVGSVPWGATPEQSLHLIAEGLGREAEAERVLADYHAYLAGVAAEHPEFAGKTFTYLDIYSGTVANYAQDHIVNSVMYEIGFEPSAGTLAIPAGEAHQEVSTERLPEHDADIVFAYPFGSTLEELKTAIPTLAAMDSVNEGRFFLLEDLAFSNSSLLSVPYALERLLPRITDALAN